MSISLVSATSNTEIGGVDVAVPINNAEENDVVIVFGGHGVGESTIDAPTGYTAIATDTTQVPSGAWYKVMGATPDTSVTCDGGGNAADAVVYCVWVLRGVDTTNVLDVSATQATGTASGPDNASITPSTAGSWVLALAMSTVLDVSVVQPTGYEMTVEATRNTTNDVSVAGATYDGWASGAEDPSAWTFWSNGNWHAITVAIRPGSSTAFRGSLLRGNTG